MNMYQLQKQYSFLKFTKTDKGELLKLLKLGKLREQQLRIILRKLSNCNLLILNQECEKEIIYCGAWHAMDLMDSLGLYIGITQEPQ